jgi:glycosyltransferase involved in cell wall biosynthesis
LPVVVDLDTWRGTPSRWRGAVKKLVYPQLLKRVTHFAPGGNRQAAYLRSFGVPDEKITTIQMTVDVGGIRQFLASEPTAGAIFRQRFGVPTDATMALFLGRLVSLKGLDDLLTAWPQVRVKAPGARLVIAGDGELREKIAEAGAVDSSIHPVGRLSGDDVWRAYAAADYVVAPSHIEPWGLVVNEAMAAGAPVVVTDIFGCVGDLARDNETAIVIPAHAPDRLAEAMTRLALHPAKRHRLASVASEVISDWTIENEARIIADIWRRVLGIGTNDSAARSAVDGRSVGKQ